MNNPGGAKNAQVFILMRLAQPNTLSQSPTGRCPASNNSMMRRRFGLARALRITVFMTIVYSKRNIPVKEYTGKNATSTH
jgi:hypothetical protein